MSELPYQGRYVRFETEGKREAADLLGADNLIGDRYDIAVSDDDGPARAWLVNRFGKRVGFLDEDETRLVRVLIAKGWTVRAFLSFVAFTEKPAPGDYWGQVALICNDPRIEEAASRFEKNLSSKLSEGIRPDIDLGASGVGLLVESDGSWLPRNRMKLPEEKDGVSIVKESRSLNEKLIEESRRGNKGCYVASWLFIAAIVVLIVLIVRSCGVV